MIRIYLNRPGYQYLSDLVASLRILSIFPHRILRDHGRLFAWNRFITQANENDRVFFPNAWHADMDPHPGYAHVISSVFLSHHFEFMIAKC